ncbi:hypothetical protein ABEF95_015310 [Exophiala dermatitidis]
MRARRLAQAKAKEGNNDSLRFGRDGGTSSFAAVSDTRAQEEDWGYKGTDNIFLAPSGEFRYIGASSSTYLAKKLAGTSTESDLAWDMHPMYRDASSLKRPRTPVLPQLPPYDFARRLYYAQHIYFGPIFSFLHPDVFESRLQYIYHHPPNIEDREECLTYCQILLIFAFGQMYSINQWSSSDGPPGFTYFKNALWLLPEPYQEGSVLFVEVLSLIAPYLQNLNRRDAAFLYIGLAIRMAISLGLHQEVQDPGLDPVEREHRRRVWWSVYSMDRIICVKSGNPVSIHDEDIEVSPPSSLSGFDLEGAPSSILALYTDLSRILGKIGESIYREKPRSGSNLLAAVQGIMSDLSGWMNRVPQDVRIDFNTLDRPLSRGAISTFLHYYHCINMTTRPLLFYICQRRQETITRGVATPDWKEGLPANMVLVIENAISAAHASTMIASAAAKQNLFATYGFMDGEHAFSAALTLVMINVTFPVNARNAAAMESALDVLSGMAEKGNEHIRARLSMLMMLRQAMSDRRGPKPSHTETALLHGPYTSNDASRDGSEMASTSTSAASAASAAMKAVPLQYDAWPPPIQDIPLNVNTVNGTEIWGEISGSIYDAMDNGWLADTLRNHVNVDDCVF